MDFVAESAKGRQELLEVLDRIAPFCAALIDALLQLNNDLSEFVRDYFKCPHSRSTSITISNHLYKVNFRENNTNFTLKGF